MQLERLFTSRTRVKLLELFLLHPEREIHVREICRMTGLTINAVRRELANLEELGILRSRTAGNARFCTANLLCPIYPELTLVLLKMGHPRKREDRVNAPAAGGWHGRR